MYSLEVLSCPGSVAWHNAQVGGIAATIIKPCRGFDPGSKSSFMREDGDYPGQGVPEPVAQPGRAPDFYCQKISGGREFESRPAHLCQQMGPRNENSAGFKSEKVRGKAFKNKQKWDKSLRLQPTSLYQSIVN